MAVMKKIILYIPEGGGAAAARFETKMTGIAGKHVPTVCRDGENLERELRKPWVLIDLVLLFVGAEEDLEMLISLQELLEDIPVLMTIPESRRHIYKRAHMLRPRFLSAGVGDFSDFGGVLQKMIQNRDQRPGAPSG